MVRTGLVLGAGGMVGQAYNAGVLAALEQDLGWDPRTAEVVVGTSAGSVTGTALRLGVAASDLFASACEVPLSPEGAAFFDLLDGADQNLPSPSPLDLLRGWRPPSGRLLARAVREPWTLRAGAVAGSLLPPGRYDLRERTRVLDRMGRGWPADLWVCAARRDDGRRAVFGRDSMPIARLSDAVAASCAIPGYFAPVQIGTRHYVDGGTHSPTNADVLTHAGLDLVVVVSSMSAAHGSSRRPDAAIRWAAHRRLEQEIRLLRAQGTAVVRFEPDRATMSTMGLNPMAEDRSEHVATAARESAAAHAQSTRSLRRLAPLLAA